MRTKNCYELIHSYKALEEFIGILPDEQDGEQFYITLFARKKYDLSGLLRSDKNCIKRITARKRDIIQKLEQLEVGVGSYSYDGVAIPEECLAVYITPNPRSFRAASVKLAKMLVGDLCDGNRIGNPYSEALNCLQTSSTNKVYFDIDVDFLEPKELEWFKEAIANFINLDCLTFIRTRGGYHVLVKLAQISPEFKHWHQGFVKLRFGEVQIMMNSDGLIPICGATQGGFTPVLEKV